MAPLALATPTSAAGREAVLELGHQLSGLADRQEYLNAAAQTLMAILPGDVVGWNAVDVLTGWAEVVSHPAPARDSEALARSLLAVADDHPLVLSYRAEPMGALPAPRRLSDVATLGQLLGTRTYAELLRPFGTRHQLTILAGRVSEGNGRVWSISRSSGDFTDAERDVALAVQPILVLLDRAVFRELTRLSPEQQEAADACRLTARELEVLQQVGTGLTADAIAHLMRISARTVRKHLENAYRKLDCHDRLLAVQKASDLHLLPLREVGRRPSAVLVGPTRPRHHRTLASG